MLEAYQAYGDYESMMDLTEGIVVEAIDAISEGGRGKGEGGSKYVLPWGDKHD